jgi:hypothetical protein
MDIIEITVLGHTLRAPREEAETFARRVEELEQLAGAVPALLVELDEARHRHERVERQLDVIRRAAAAASRALTDEPASLSSVPEAA